MKNEFSTAYMNQIENQALFHHNLSIQSLLIVLFHPLGFPTSRFEDKPYIWGYQLQVCCGMISVLCYLLYENSGERDTRFILIHENSQKKPDEIVKKCQN